MVTDNKVKSEADIYDNVNTRDQNRTLIILLVIVGFFLFGLIGLGLSHAPENPPAPQEGQNTQATGEQPLQSGFSVNKISGEVELPGTIGKPQHFLIGHGNQPAQSTEESAGASNTTTSTTTGVGAGSAQPSDKSAPSGNSGTSH